MILWVCDQLPSPSPHLILPGLQGQTPEAQRRREGNTLTVKCPYTAQTEEWHVKYWCLLTSNGGCREVVSTSSATRERSSDRRTTIEDDTNRKIVTITMTDLKAVDSGTYFCAIYHNGFVRLRTVLLNVFRGEYLSPTQRKVFSGSNIIPSSALPPSPPQLSNFP